MDRKAGIQNLLDWAYLHRRAIAVILIVILAGSLILDGLFGRQELPIIQARQKDLIQEEIQRVAQINTHINDINDHLSAFQNSIESGNYPQALEEISYVIEHEEPNAEYYLKRGGVYVLMEDYHSAMEDLDKSLELKPDQSDIYSLKGQIYLLQEDYKNAISVFEQALELSEGTPEIYYNLAISLIMTEQYDHVREYLNHVLENDCSEEMKADCRTLLEALDEAEIP